MENFLLGFFTGGSLIFAIGPQNLFVIEQGLKKNYIFTITTICAVSDILLIFLGVFIYYIFKNIPLKVEIILNMVLILFLLKYIWERVKSFDKNYTIKFKEQHNSLNHVIMKTLGFTYLNPHVYSDTVFILGNLSKNFLFLNKFYFAIGASLASLIFFYSLGYLSSIFANFIKSQTVWKNINIFIIFFMSVLVIYIIFETFSKIF